MVKVRLRYWSDLTESAVRSQAVILFSSVVHGEAMVTGSQAQGRASCGCQCHIGLSVYL